MDTEITPDDFRLSEEIDLEGTLSTKRPPRHRQTDSFLKGPIPWTWLERAMQLPHKALHVALVIWKAAGIKNRRTVRINLSTGIPGISRWTAYRGLHALELEKLVTVIQHPGQIAEVTLLNVESNKSK